MANTYLEMKEKHQKESNQFWSKYGFFAFSNKQFSEGLEKLGIKESEASEKLYKGFAGGFYLREKADIMKEMYERHEKEMTEQMNKDDDFLFNAFRYELSNHEYCVTYDPTDTLECLDITLEELNKDKRMLKIFQKAKQEYLENVITW